MPVTGAMTASKKFDIYGATRGYRGTPTTRQGFVGGLGHESDDETGLVNMRARYYDPGTGRFISEDSARSGNNWFCYASDDPINHVDPNGHDAVLDLVFWLCMITFGYQSGSDSLAGMAGASFWRFRLLQMAQACKQNAVQNAEMGAESGAASEELENMANAMLQSENPVAILGYDSAMIGAAREARSEENYYAQEITNIVVGVTAEQCAAWMQ